MSNSVNDYETLGFFYLGKDYDIKTREVTDKLTLYDSKNLVTHSVVLGMTGSGKTGLCMGLLEEAAMDHIPAIVIDPKGDIANLMLTLPDFKGSDFRPWINGGDARKKGSSPDEYAEKTAKRWGKGIGTWHQSPDRVRQLQDKIDIHLFPPGSQSGIPVSILSSLDAPPFEVIDDGELLGERIESTVSSLLSLVRVNADPIQSPVAILLSSIFQHVWTAEQSLTLESLIRNIQRPSFNEIGVIDLESFLPAKERQKLALKFNSLLASLSFSTWLEGPRKGAGFDELAGYAMNADNYKAVGKDCADWIYRNERVTHFQSPLYQEYSKPDQSAGDFRARLMVKGREAELAEEIAELEAKSDVNNTELDTEKVKPYKKDIDVNSVSLIWLPYNEDEKVAC
ncbi:MAG: helicase HerA domain-containing protein [Akkermansiaceae bacterium]